jgi:hypothetical protein
MPTKRKMKPSLQAVSFFGRRNLVKAGRMRFSAFSMLEPGSDVVPSSKG